MFHNFVPQQTFWTIWSVLWEHKDLLYYLNMCFSWRHPTQAQSWVSPSTRLLCHWTWLCLTHSCDLVAAGKRRSAEKKRQTEQSEAPTAVSLDEEPPEPKWHWITTTPSGERVVTKQNENTNIPVQCALVSKASDPSTLQVRRWQSLLLFCCFIETHFAGILNLNPQ